MVVQQGLKAKTSSWFHYVPSRSEDDFNAEDIEERKPQFGFREEIVNFLKLSEISWLFVKSEKIGLDDECICGKIYIK